MTSSSFPPMHHYRTWRKGSVCVKTYGGKAHPKTGPDLAGSLHKACWMTPAFAPVLSSERVKSVSNSSTFIPIVYADPSAGRIPLGPLLHPVTVPRSCQMQWHCLRSAVEAAPFSPSPPHQTQALREGKGL